MGKAAHPDTAPATLFEKIWRQHLIEEQGAGGGVLAIDRTFLHERTGSVALKTLGARGISIMDPTRVFCTIDHIVDTTPGRSDVTRVPGGSEFIRETREAARKADIRLFDVNDPEQGIVHVISPELGLVLPGATVVCPDSHTCTQGALAAMAWGIGSSEAEEVLATGALRVEKPRTLRVTFAGRRPAAIVAKDMSLALISRHGAAGGNGCVVEYAGQAVRELDMEGRLTLCNMTTEFSAMTGLIAPDELTFAYLRGRRYAPRGEIWRRALASWRLLRSDDDARFDGEIQLDVTELEPMVTWGTSPAHAVAITKSVPSLVESRIAPEAYERALAYMGLSPGEPVKNLVVEGAFIGSCTNSRISDLERAARLLAGRHVAPGVRAICVPGSTTVKRMAESRGLHRVFAEAGFEWRESGCSMCFYAGGESFGHRQRVISSTNRNFEGRQGPQTRTHIASPETVAASAVMGRIADPRNLMT